MSKAVFTHAATEGGFHVLRNGSAMTTPAGAAFVLPTKVLAARIAEEWRGQGPKPKPETMPMLQLASTALDIIAKNPAGIVESVAGYAASDLLCHFADEPPALLKQQHQQWTLWLDWAATRYGARLKVGQGIMPIAQAPEALAVFRKQVAGFDKFRLAGLQQAVSITGSLILGLALAEGAIDVETTFAVAELDALFQMKQWGEDPVTLARHEGLRRDLKLCWEWFQIV